MPSKAPLTRVKAKHGTRPVRRDGANLRVKKPLRTKNEAERLAHFKALMLETGGKLKFAGMPE